MTIQVQRHLWDVSAPFFLPFKDFAGRTSSDFGVSAVEAGFFCQRVSLDALDCKSSAFLSRVAFARAAMKGRSGYVLLFVVTISDVQHAKILRYESK